MQYLKQILSLYFKIVLTQFKFILCSELLKERSDIFFALPFISNFIIFILVVHILLDSDLL